MNYLQKEPRMSMTKAGLEGITVGSTAISTVGKEGVGLTYRGYDIHDLANNASFEEVAYLLMYGSLPDTHTLQQYKQKLSKLRHIPSELKRVLEAIPSSAHPMDVLRTGVSMLGTLEMQSNQYHARDIADRLLACMPSMLLYWYLFHRDHTKLEPVNFQDKTLAGYFLHALHGKEPNPEIQRAIDVSLILYAEHEFNASTFAARVTTSTQSDFYSAIVSAIGTLRGPLHGGANEEAMRLIAQFKTVEQADIGIHEMLANKAKIMGFGHRVYKHSDPRSDIIKQWSRQLSQQARDGYLFAISECIENVMRSSKNLFPNLDFYSASTYHFCGIPTALFTPLFVLSRITGWSAHIFEQQENNRLIRPEADYTGPEPKKLIPINERG
jgi:2-methylcitrate synthase